ncbi:hypothetical protein [Oceanobacillus jeddahense]|uniref:hypothetical protein n=1 Tax=Oceanobacillus jeddahense TaxID=1462527 RepID=UPI00362555F5
MAKITEKHLTEYSHYIYVTLVMPNKQITQTQYTQTSGNYQLYLPMDVEEMIPMDDSVRLHCLLCERSWIAHFKIRYFIFGDKRKMG